MGYRITGDGEHFGYSFDTACYERPLERDMISVTA
jgi:hypothetical protein